MQSETERIAPAANSGRNVGVDTLRVVSMLMILCVHILTQGGVLAAVQPGTAEYALAWLLRCFLIVDVNCFALITGYVSVDARFRLSRPIALWLEVLIYSVGISAVFRLLGIYAFVPDVAFLPVLNGRWWYVTAYFGMVLFLPFFRLLFDKMSRKQASMLVFAVILVLSVLPSFYDRDIFRSSKGYTMLWLMALYVIGAYIRRHEPFPRSRRRWLLVYALSMLVVWLTKLLLPRFGADGDYFVNFTSFFVLLGSVSLLLFFSRVSVAPAFRKLTAFFSPLAFGVYLIHVHPAVWNYLLAGRFAFLAEKGPLLLIPGVVGCALGIFLLCCAVDWLRSLVFRLLRVSRLAELLGDKLTALADKIFR